MKGKRNRVPGRQVKGRAKPWAGAAPQPAAQGPGLVESAAMFPPPSPHEHALLQGSAFPSASQLQEVWPPTSQSAAALPEPRPQSTPCAARPGKPLFKGRGCAASALRDDVTCDVEGGALRLQRAASQPAYPV